MTYSDQQISSQRDHSNNLDNLGGGNMNEGIQSLSRGIGTISSGDVVGGLYDTFIGIGQMSLGISEGVQSHFGHMEANQMEYANTLSSIQSNDSGGDFCSIL